MFSNLASNGVKHAARVQAAIEDALEAGELEPGQEESGSQSGNEYDTEGGEGDTQGEDEDNNRRASKANV